MHYNVFWVNKDYDVKFDYEYNGNLAYFAYTHI